MIQILAQVFDKETLKVWGANVAALAAFFSNLNIIVMFTGSVIAAGFTAYKFYAFWKDRHK